LTLPPEAVARWFGIGQVPNWPPRYNIAPTDDVPMIFAADGRMILQQARWDLRPFWAKGKKRGPPLINARSESLGTRFRQQLQRYRCLVPADGWYEWRTEGGLKQPYLVRRADRAPIALAGICAPNEAAEPGGPAWTMAIVTRDALPELADLHERMPAVLRRDDQAAWLDVSGTPAEAASHLIERVEDGLEIVRVSREVNSVRFDGEVREEKNGEDSLPLFAAVARKH
jgi:putative SOS response-associated peptidase YedK